MSALARHHLASGDRVAGYDRTQTELTHHLEHEGASIVYDDDDALIPNDFRNPQETLVVVTPAVPPTSRILCYFRAHGHRVVKRSEALGALTDGRRMLCVAGTHGKTTTSTLMAHILAQTPGGCRAYLGGVARNYGTNYLATGRQETIVTEADEYDRSFLQLHPLAAIVTAMDADHLDIYGTHAAVVEAFMQFVAQIRPGGILLARHALPLAQQDVDPAVKVVTYAATDTAADFHARNIRSHNDRLTFDIHARDYQLTDLSMSLPGLHNVENAVAAAALTHLMGVPDDDIRRALASFLGDRRRFEVHYETPSAAVVDDYAHHPQEIRATIQAARLRYPDRHITVCFQPHLYSRTRDLAPQFANALSLADRTLILDIYPAREQPIPGVTAQTILDLMPPLHAQHTTKDALTTDLLSRPLDVVIVMGAGDIELLVPQVVSAVERYESET